MSGNYLVMTKRRVVTLQRVVTEILRYQRGKEDCYTVLKLKLTDVTSKILSVFYKMRPKLRMKKSSLNTRMLGLIILLE